MCFHTSCLSMFISHSFSPSHVTAKLQFNIQLQCFDSVIIIVAGILAVGLYFLGVSEPKMTHDQFYSHVVKNSGKNYKSVLCLILN